MPALFGTDDERHALYLLRFVWDKVDPEKEDRGRLHLPTVSICRFNNVVTNTTNAEYVNATYTMKKTIDDFLLSINIFGGYC